MTAYDVIVIGAGHAGQEAALAAARLGARVLLVTPNLDRVAHMACNCSIGGPAKGHMVREVDALGGEIGIAADETCTHIRMLNTSKGPAVQALRVQSDKRAYEDRAKRAMEATPGLHLLQSEVTDLLVESGAAVGVRTSFDEEIRGGAVVLAAGTFLGGATFYGHTSHPMGRAGEQASEALGRCLRGLGLPPVRLKTGTSPRLALDSIATDELEVQRSDPAVSGFSWRTGGPPRCVHHPCWVTLATAETTALVRAHLDDSALFGGLVSGPGPRYCPSIEAKVVRFPDRHEHKVFLELEGERSTEVYVQGLSNSLPPEIQLEMLHTLPGLGQVRVLRYGYAVEYDAYDPRALTPSLESTLIRRFFLAGQVNGTSGYEEAAAQGLIAGVSAARVAGGGDGVSLPRLSSYIGVMLADLVEKGVDEPYRIMTARAANRLHLRSSSAAQRLTPLSRAWGLVGAEQWAHYERAAAALDRVTQWFAQAKWEPGSEAWPGESWGQAPQGGRPLTEVAERPHVEIAVLARLAGAPEAVLEDLRREEVEEEATARLKHRGYLERERIRVMGREEASLVALDFTQIPGLKAEAVTRLTKMRPSTLSEARSMRGITSADLDALEVFARRASGRAADVSRETSLEGEGSSGE